MNTTIRQDVIQCLLEAVEAEQLYDPEHIAHLRSIMQETPLTEQPKRTRKKQGPMSEERKQKIRDGHKRRTTVVSDEARAKISAAARRPRGKGRWTHRDETKLRISEANRQRVYSEETRQRMSESAKRRWERERLKNKVV